MKIRQSINSPIRKNILANFYGIGIVLLNQIVLVPFYIVFWGNELYSDWIVISALTSIFCLSDAGLNSVIQNRFAIKMAEGDDRECKSLLASNYTIITVVAAALIAIGLGYVSIFDITEQMNLRVVDRLEGSKIFMLLLVQVFITMYSTIANAVYRAVHKNSIAVYMDQTAKLFIVLITLVCLYLHTSLSLLCLLLCLPNALLLIIKTIAAQRYYKYVFSFKDVNFRLIRGLLPPSLAYMLFPVANAIIGQGFTLVVNRFWVADTVVLYNTTRTMCNFLKTFLNTITNSVWPEYSIAYGKGDKPRMKSLYNKTVRISLIAAIAISVALLAAGPFVYEIWTRGKVVFEYGLMLAFLLDLNLNTIWNSGCVALISTNNHVKLGFMFSGFALVSLMLGILAASVTQSLVLTALSLCIMEIALIIFVRKQVPMLWNTK